jgi:small subunit ribosomal protein S6
MRDYEAMFIFKPDLEGEDLEKVVEHVEEVITKEGKGKTKHDNLGKRTLAYPINKLREGVYVNYQFSAEPLTIIKIKDALQHDESIVRFIVFAKETKA